MKFISESKKTDITQKLREKYPNDEFLIERCLNLDPTNTKYVEYIGKLLDRYIIEKAGPNGGLSVSDGIYLENTLNKWINWFHLNQEKINEQDISEAKENYLEFNQKLDNKKIDLIQKSPKDINNYTDLSFFNFVMEVVNSRKTKSEKETEAKSESVKVYEDSEVLVVEPQSHNSSCYYGYGTKWCTSTKDNPSQFQSYSKKGSLYYFINKKDNFKYALYKPNKQSAQVWTSNDIQVTLQDLLNEFPNQEALISELAGVSDFPIALKKWVKGKISTDELLDIEPSLMQPIIQDNNRSRAKLIFEFENDEEFLDLLSLSDDDINFLQMVNSPYNNFEFFDYSSARDEFLEGYGAFSNLDIDNKNLLDKICLFFTGLKYDFQNPDENFLKLLENLFEREIDDIVMDYTSERNHEMTLSAQESIDEELTNFMKNYGFEFDRPYYRVETTPGNIVMYSTLFKMTKGDIKEIIKKITENSTGRLGGWWDEMYEFRNDEFFDDLGFNQSVNTNLESIIEKMTEIPEFEETYKKIGEISKDYETRKYYMFPTSKKYLFAIEKYDLEKKRVLILINDANYQNARTVFMSIDGFWNLLNQPTLFDFDELFLKN